MNIPLYFVVSVLSALTVATIVWAMTRRRLYVVVPKLFPHSNLADKGKTVELTLFNRGYKTEQLIVVELEPSLEYTLIAAGSPTVRLSKANLSVNRLPGNDETTVILLVENGDFTSKAIITASSEHCKAKIVEKPDEIFPAAGTALGSFAAFLFYSAVVFGAGWFFHAETALDSPEQSPLISATPVEVPPNLQAKGWTHMERYVNSTLFDPENPDVFPITLTIDERDENTVTFAVELYNHGSDVLTVSGSLLSPVEDTKNIVPVGADWLIRALVFPGQTVSRTLTVYLPKDFEKQMVVANFNLNTPDANVYNLERYISLSN